MSWTQRTRSLGVATRALLVLGLLTAALAGLLVQGAAPAQAQGFPGGGFAATAQGAGVVLLTWNAGTLPTGGKQEILQTGPGTTTSTIGLLAGDTQKSVTLPIASQSSACWRYVVRDAANNDVAHSDDICALVGIATTGSADDVRISVSGTTANLSWVLPGNPTAQVTERTFASNGTTTGITTFSSTSPASRTLGTSLTCYNVNASASSDWVCAQRAASGQLAQTPTPTSTPTATRTNTPTATATSTVGPPTNTPTATPTATPSGPPDLTIVTFTDTPDPVAGPVPPAVTGGTITYNVVGRNIGGATANNATFRVTLPGGTAFVSVSPATISPAPPNGTPAFNCDGAGAVAACTGGDLLAGASISFQVVASVNSCVTPITATAIADPSLAITEVSETNNTATTTTVVTCVGPDLVVTLADSPDPVPAGGNVTYTATVQNVGSASTGTPVHLHVSLSPGLTFVSATVPAGVTCDNVGHADAPGPAGFEVVHCNIATMAAGAQVAIPIIAVASGSAPVQAVAVVDPNATIAENNEGGDDPTVTSIATPPHSCNGVGVPAGAGAAGLEPDNVDCENTTVTGALQPDLVITLADSPDPVVSGGVVTHTATVTNQGTLAANPVHVHLGIPAAGYTFSGATPSQGICSLAGHGDGFVGVHCDLGSIAGNNGQATITMTGVVNLAFGTVVFGAQVDPNPAVAPATVGRIPEGTREGRNDPAVVCPAGINDGIAQTAPAEPDNVDCEETSVTGPDLTVTKAASATIVAPGGTTVTYTITVRNIGSNPAGAVHFHDNWPASFDASTVTTSQGSCRLEANTGDVDGDGVNDVECDLGTIDAGGTVTITVVGVLTLGVCDFADNNALVDPNNTINEQREDNNTFTRRVRTVCSDLTVTLSDSPDPVPTGGTLTHTAVVTNTGDSPAAAVHAHLDLPNATCGVGGTDPCVVFQSVTTSQGTCANRAVTPDPNDATLVGQEDVWCNLGLIAAGANATITVTSVVSQGSGTVTATATVDPNDTVAEQSNANNAASQTTAISGPDLTVTVAESVDPVTTGGALRYTVTVGNIGNATAGSVHLHARVAGNFATVDTITPSVGACALDPDDTIAVSPRDIDGFSGGGAIECNLGNILAGGSATVTVDVTAGGVGVITFGAQADPNLVIAEQREGRNDPAVVCPAGIFDGAPQGAPAEPDNVDCETTTVAAEVTGADLDVEKLADPCCPLVIADVSTQDSFIFVPAGAVGLVTDVDVFIDLTHTFLADLDVFLTHLPTGTQIALFTDVCGNNDDMRVTLDDAAATAIGSACASPTVGAFQPEAPALLSTFNGLDPAGDWRLRIIDDFGADVGVLNTWRLIINGVAFGGEDLDAFLGYTSVARFRLRNDGGQAITGITWSGNITGTANRTGMSAGIGGGGGTWSCPIQTVNAWTCTGDLGPNNTSDVIITFGVTGTGVTGNTVVYIPLAPTCTAPGACDDAVVSTTNADGSDLTPAAHVDTLGAANLNITIANDSPAGEDLNPANLPTAGYSARILYGVGNTGTEAITGVTISGTYTGSAARTGSTLGSVVGLPGWACGTTTADAFSCGGDVAAGANGTFELRVAGPDTATAGQTVVFTITSVSCTGPGPCLDGFLSPANPDGSDLSPGPDTDTLVSADLDVQFVDAPGGEDFAANAYTSKARYLVFNDGTPAITGITISGTITGTAPRTGGGVAVTGGPAAWSCLSNIPAGTWSCTGNLSADDGVLGDNIADGDDVDQVTITVTVTGSGQGDQTVIYTLNPPVCTVPGACTDGLPSAANADGGDLTPTADTDTLFGGNLNIAHIDEAGFNGFLTPQVIAGGIDVNGDGAITAADDSNAYFGDNSIINGLVDCNGDAAITAADDCALTPTVGPAIFVVDGILRTGPLTTDPLFNGPLPAAVSLAPLLFGTTDVSWRVINGRVDSNGSGVIDGDDCSFNIVGGAHILGNPGANECGFGVAPSPALNGMVDLNADSLITGADTCSGCFFGRDVIDGLVQDEDLSAAGGYISRASYSLTNAGTQAVTGITWGGAIGGAGAVRVGAQIDISGGDGSWSCSVSTTAWNCTGNLAANNGVPGGNDEVLISVTVTGTGAAGNTVTYDPGAPACATPGACTSGTQSPANNDGSVINLPLDTDTLT